MNSTKIKNLGGPPVDDSDAANKKYVDNENAKQDIAITDKASESYVDNEIAKIPKNVLLKMSLIEFIVYQTLLEHSSL